MDSQTAQIYRDVYYEISLFLKPIDVIRYMYSICKASNNLLKFDDDIRACAQSRFDAYLYVGCPHVHFVIKYLLKTRVVNPGIVFKYAVRHGAVKLFEHVYSKYPMTKTDIGHGIRRSIKYSQEEILDIFDSRGAVRPENIKLYLLPKITNVAFALKFYKKYFVPAYLHDDDHDSDDGHSDIYYATINIMCVMSKSRENMDGYLLELKTIFDDLELRYNDLLDVTPDENLNPRLVELMINMMPDKWLNVVKNYHHKLLHTFVRTAITMGIKLDFDALADICVTKYTDKLFEDLVGLGVVSKEKLMHICMNWTGVYNCVTLKCVIRYGSFTKNELNTIYAYLTSLNNKRLEKFLVYIKAKIMLTDR